MDTDADTDIAILFITWNFVFVLIFLYKLLNIFFRTFLNQMKLLYIPSYFFYTEYFWFNGLSMVEYAAVL